MSFNMDLMTEINHLGSNVPKVDIDTNLKLKGEITPTDFEIINGSNKNEAVSDITDNSIDLKKAEKEANERTEQIIKARRYMNLTEVNNDIIQRFDNETVKELFPNEDTVGKDNSDIIAMLHRLANDEKNANAQNMLAVCYISGIGVEINEEVALRFFEQAAEQNHPTAQRNLAIMLENQDSPDKNKIIELYEKSAAQNDAYALNNLTACYLMGDGVKKNIKEAVNLFEKAVNLGDDYAMVNLADCYSVGNGVKKDNKKAYELYAMAAEQKNQDGLLNAAECLFSGNGVKQNLTKAMEYFKIAADMGNEAAQKRFDEIQAKISPKKHDDIKIDGKETNKKSSLSDSFEFFKNAAENKEESETHAADKQIEDTKPISKGER